MRAASRGVDESLACLDRIMTPAWHLHSVIAEPGIGYCVVVRETGPRPWQHRRVEGYGNTIPLAIDDAASRMEDLLLKPEGGTVDDLAEADRPREDTCHSYWATRAVDVELPAAHRR